MSKLAEDMARLQQAPNVSEQMAKLDQMMAVGYDDYWKGRQPTKSPFADFRGLSTPRAQPVPAQPMPDLTQPLLEPTTQEKAPETGSGWGVGETLKALGKGAANYTKAVEQRTAGTGMLWADFWQDRLGKKITDMAARDELTPEQYKQMKFAQRTPEEALWGENGLTIVADDDPRAKAAKLARTKGIITQSEAKRIDAARNVDMVFNRDLRARWAKFVEAAERGEIKLTDADENGRSVDPQKLYADFKRFERGNYEGVTGYRPKAGEMKLGDNEWAQEVGYNRRNERLLGWHEDAESRKNKNTYERGTPAYYTMILGESLPDLLMMMGGAGLARGAVGWTAARSAAGKAAEHAAERAAMRAAINAGVERTAAREMAAQAGKAAAQGVGRTAAANTGSLTGSAFIGEQVAAQAYADARASGLEPQAAAIYATWYGLAEAIPEKFALGKILRGNGTIRRQALRGMMAEAAQESVTQVLQNTADIKMLDRKMSLKEFLLSTLDAAVVGGLMGGTMGVVHGVAQKMGEAEQVNYADEWRRLVEAGLNGRQGGTAQDGTPPAPGGNPAPGNPTHPGGTPSVNPNPAPQGQGAAPPQAGSGNVSAAEGVPDVANDELQEDLNELATAGAQPWAGWFSPDEIAAIARTDLEAALRISSAQRVLADPDVPESAKRQTVNDITSPADLVAGMRERFGDNIIGQEAAAQTAATPAQQQAAPQAADNPAPMNNPAVNPVADSTAPQANPAGQASNPAPDSAQQTVAGQQHIANRRSVAGMTAEARRQASQLGTTAFDARIDAMEAAYAAQEPTDPERAIQAFNAASDAISQDMIQYARANGYTAQRSNSPGGFDWVKPNQTTPTPQPPQNPAPPAPPPQNPAPANPAPNTPPAPPTTGGGQSTIRANGQEHGVTFEVREAASLTPATEAGTANQARNRASNAQSAAQVANIAANLDPVTLTADTHEMDTGMPTLARDGQTIIAGNGRTMAVQQAYAQHPERAQAYKQHLIDNAAAYGLDPAAIAQMQNPVLVRRFTDDVDVQQMATASNAGTGMSLSAYELAATDAQALPADLRNLVGGTDGMIDPATGTNAAVMGQWAQALPENRRNAVYTQDGRTLSREGLLAFRNAVLYRAYGEGVDMGDGIISRQTLADIIENSVEELRNVRNALVNIAPRVVDMKARVQQGLYPAELDISADLLRASESLTQTRKANGPTVESIINQQNLDGSSYPANAATLLRYFNAHIRSGADIRSYLNGYYDWANAQQSTNTADIFGAAPPTAAQGLAEAARAVNEGRQLGAAGQANIHYSTPPQAGGFGISIPAGWPQDEHAEFAHPSLYEQYRRQFGDDIVARLAHLQNLSTNPALPDETRVDALREQTAILNYFRNGGTRPDIPANPYAPPRKAPPPVNQATQQVATRDGTQHSNGNETLPPPQQRALPPAPGQTQANTAQETAAQEQTAAPDYAAVRRLLERILGKRLAEKVTLSNTLPNGQPMPQEGAYLADGTLIINPDAIRSFEVDGVTVLTREQRIAWVAWHEFVHRGADYHRQVWGGKEWQTTLSKLRQNSALRHLAEAIQAERNAAYLNSGQDVRVTPEQAMEEALAELAAAIQQGNADALIARYGRFAPTTGRTKLQALLGKMADVIRRVLGRITKRQITQEELSDADAIGLLRDITALQGADDLADAQRMAGVTARQTPPAQAAERAVQRQERMAPVDAAAYSTPLDTLRKHTAASDLETVTDTLLTNARSDGSRADTHSVNTIDDSTPQSAAAQGVRHSTTPSLDEAEDSAFARAVDDVVAGKVSAGYISLGTTPEVLKLIGVPDGKVRISGGTIEKAMAGYLNRNNSYDENRHAIRPEDMKQLPAHLNAPIAVFKSATRADSFVVLTELMELENGRDKPVIAALHLQEGKRGLNLVDIASVYGRSNGQLVRAFDTDLLYLNKQKGRQFLTTHPLQLHWDITSDADLSARNIKTNEDLTQEKQTLQQEFEATAQQYGGAFDPADANIYHSTAPETGDQTPDARQQRTLRLASNRILNIARAIQSGGKYISGEPIDFGTTPPVYQALGAEALPLKILNPRKLFSLLRPKSEQGQRGDNTHELTPELLAQVPQALQEPTLVFDSEQPGALVAVTSLQDSKGNPVVAAIHLSREAGFIRINKIASIYGKDNAGSVFNRWQREGKLRYVDTKNPSLLTSDGVQFSQEKSAKELEHTVLTDADVVKLQQQLTQTEAETKAGQALLGTGQDGEKFSIPPQLVTDPPTQAGLGKRIWQAVNLTDPAVRDLWFDRQGELERILKADPNAQAFRNGFKMYGAKTQNTLEGAPAAMVDALVKDLAANYDEAIKQVPFLKNTRGNAKTRQAMFMSLLDFAGQAVYHGRERNAVILQRSKGKQTDGSGFSEADIRTFIDWFNSAEAGNGIILRMYEDLYKNHLQPMMQMSDGYLRESGLLTPEMEAARPNYQWYVPLYGAPQMEDTAIERIVKNAEAAKRPNNGGASRTDVIRNRIHNATGRHGTKAANLFENVMSQLEASVRRAEMQEPKRRLWEYARTPEGARLLQATTSSYTINGGNRNTRGGRSWQKHTPDADEVVWQDGDTIHRIHIGNLRALEAIRNFNRQAITRGANFFENPGAWLFEKIGNITRLQGGSYTRFNPVFILRNKFMDSPQQWFLMMADAPIGRETRAGLSGYADAVGNIGRRTPVVLKAMRYNAQWTAAGFFDPTYQRYLKEFGEDGGKTSYAAHFAPEKMQALQDLLWREATGVVRRMANPLNGELFRSMGDFIGALNEHMEMTTRISAYAALRENGVPREQAAVWAKDVMNFETKGDLSIKANMLFPFFTTSMYDNRRLFKVLKSKEGQIIFVALIGAFAMLQEMLAHFGGEDDDGIAWIDKYPMSISGSYLIAPVASDDGVMRGEGFRIPVGFGLSRTANALAASTRRYLNGTDDGGRFISNIVNHVLVGNFSPKQPSDVDITKDPAAWLVNTVTPEPVKPVVQFAMNKNYRGAPIYDDGSMRSPGELDYNSGYDSTPDVYRKAAQAWYDATGYDVAPESLQHWARSYGGGVSDFATSTVETILDRTGHGNKSTSSWWKTAPILSGFSQNPPSRDRELYTMNRERAEHRYNQLVDAATRGKDYGKYQDAAYWHEYYKATEKQIRKLRKARKELMNSRTLYGTDELRQRLRAIDGHILDIQKQANMKYREWEFQHTRTTQKASP